jgi:DNA-binding SARP family transcriptional activator/TolB-like protein
VTSVTLLARTSDEAAAQISTKLRRMVKINLAGLMKVTALNGKSILPTAKRTRAILAILCVSKGKRVARARLAALLWERSDEAHAQTSLRQSLSDLNRSIGNQVPGLIEIDRDAVRLNTRACWIDIFEEKNHFDRLLEDLDGISPRFDRWLASQRTLFEDTHRDELEGELNRMIAENVAPELRAAAARKLINFDRTHEGAVRALMIAFAEMGDRGQAVREFERCRAELKTRIDLTPSAETLAIYEAIRLVSVKNRSLNDRSYVVNLDLGKPRPLGARAPLFGHRHQLSIAVLPFQNLSPDTMHDYAAEGLLEDVTEMLSRVPSFFVISRSTTSAFKGECRPAKEVGALLGVQYVLYGSMRVVGDRLRLTAELTNANNGNVIWRSSLVEQFFDLGEIQTRLADAVVRCIAPHLYLEEYRRARNKRSEPLEAYDLLLRAQENMNSPSRTVFDTCEPLFDEAIRLDPQYATALAWRAYWHVLRVAQGWSPDPPYDAKHAVQFAQRAVDADQLEPMALAIQGHVAAYLNKDFDTAFQRFEAALRVNRNAAPAWLWSAAAHAWIGEGSRAVEEVNRAIALSPFDPLMCAYSAVAGMAYLADSQYERAIECGLRSIGENRQYSAAYKLILLALVLSGRATDTQPYLSQLLKVEPGFSVERYQRVFPGSNSAIGKIYCEALVRAGVPLQSKISPN